MTITEIIGPRPDPADITRAVANLEQLRNHRDRYPFTCGAFSHILSTLADLHTHCRIPGCQTCWHLRRGLAYIAALDEGESR